MSSETCFHCKAEYQGAYQEHFNICHAARKSGHAFTPVNLFSDRQDYAAPKQNPMLERYRQCVHCLSEINGSQQDHEDHCSVIGMRRAKDTREIPLFGSSVSAGQTEKDRISKLEKEIEALKRRQ